VENFKNNSKKLEKLMYYYKENNKNIDEHSSKCTSNCIDIRDDSHYSSIIIIV